MCVGVWGGAGRGGGVNRVYMLVFSPSAPTAAQPYQHRTAGITAQCYHVLPRRAPTTATTYRSPLPFLEAARNVIVAAAKNDR